jgi:prolipoprotein diacylglyceryltransferase
MNVNKDGNPIPGVTEDHNKVLPLPVFPTPLYEFIACAILFILLWVFRKSFKAPLGMFGLYLSMNGFERILMELIRVNNSYGVLGLRITQAEWIAGILLISGLGLMWFASKRLCKTAQ